MKKVSLSIKNKILAGMIPVFLLLLVFSVYIKKFENAVSLNSVNLESVVDKTHEVEEFRSINYSLADAARLYALTRDPQYEKQYLDLSLRFEAVYEKVLARERNTAERKQLQNFKKISDSLKGTDLLIISRVKRGDQEGGLGLFNDAYFENGKKAVADANAYLTEQQREAFSSIGTNLMAIRTDQRNLLIISFLFILIAAFFVYIILRNFIIVPIAGLAGVATLIKEGHYESRAKISSDDEIGKLALAFNAMAAKLEEELQNKAKENKALRELDERKSQFISVVAHQLRTPLSGIKWTLNMAISGEFGTLSKDLSSFLNKSYESNERMISLVNDMLGVSRIESGRFQYNFLDTNVAELAKKVVGEMQAEAVRKNMKIETDFEPDLPETYCDTEKIYQVFQNLIENAIKYTMPGGVIRVEIKKHGGFIVSSIKDTGIGIPEKDRKEIFNRFFRSENAIKVQADGSGLGLFIVKSLIERHNGKIWFETEEGKGTTFFFSLPILKGILEKKAEGQSVGVVNG